MVKYKNIHRKIFSFLFPLALVMGLMPTAFAEKYRLKEEIFGDIRTVYQYDDIGLLSRSATYSEEELLSTGEYFYNKNNQLVEKRETTDMFVLVFHYDSNGTQIEQTNSGLGGELILLKDDLPEERKEKNGRVIEVKRKYETVLDVNDTFRYTYDSKGRIKTYEVTDWFKDEFTYNKDGSFIRTRTNLMTNESFVLERYNVSGLLVERIDEHGTRWTYFYDQNGLLTNTYYSYELDDEEYVTHYSYSYEYDKEGNLSARIEFWEQGISGRTDYIYELE